MKNLKSVYYMKFVHMQIGNVTSSPIPWVSFQQITQNHYLEPTCHSFEAHIIQLTRRWSMISLPPAETFDKELGKKERRPVVARHPRKIHCGSRADVESREREKERKKGEEERDREGRQRHTPPPWRHGWVRS